MGRLSTIRNKRARIGAGDKKRANNQKHSPLGLMVNRSTTPTGGM